MKTEEYLEFTSPEKEGIKKENIEEYVSSLMKNGVCLHSFAVLRNGRLIAEGYERHYNKDSKNRMYSVSKTFTSAAVGCLIGEGKLNINDKICDYFRDLCPENIHPYVENMTVRDLLMMATPFSETTYRPENKDWVYTFFNTEPSHRSGRVFNYDTSATLVLDALVQRLTGLDFTVYLYEKVLKYIGFESAPECVREPGGVQWGGSGVLCTLRELACFALLFMNGGKSRDGKQLLPEDYVREATKMQISNNQSNDFASFRNCGYGYQIWITEMGFAFLGMGNQLAVCVPEKNLLLVTTADDQGNSHARGYIFDLFKSYVINNCENPDEKGEERPSDFSRLLHMPIADKTAEINASEEINGKTFSFLPNRNGFESAIFSFDGDEGRIEYIRDGKKMKLDFGINHYTDGIFPEIYSGKTIGTPADGGYRCTASGVWTEKDKLLIRCYIIDDYLGNFSADISFRNGCCDLKFGKTAEWFLNEYTGYLSSK